MAGDWIVVNLKVEDVNVEFGWSRQQWTPFLDFSWSDMESNILAVIYTEMNLDRGMGLSCQAAEEAK